MGVDNFAWCKWSHTKLGYTHNDILERVMGIEPTLAAWEAAVLPLNYTRILLILRNFF
jgi:hypothetical protein